ncbi:U3 snoRNP protein [Marasmius crinis-equi]|uniref:U3 snoRNP protein n=1 Tax=Marasmius crinis-equi TaxID=585013 RepID=A0ABR3ERL0_9AGAR
MAWQAMPDLPECQHLPKYLPGLYPCILCNGSPGLKTVAFTKVLRVRLALNTFLSTLSSRFKYLVTPSTTPELLETIWPALRHTLPKYLPEIQRTITEVWGSVLRKLKENLKERAVVLIAEDLDGVDDAAAWSFVYACKSVFQTVTPIPDPLTRHVLPHMPTKRRLRTHPSSTRSRKALGPSVDWDMKIWRNSPAESSSEAKVVPGSPKNPRYDHMLGFMLALSNVLYPQENPNNKHSDQLSYQLQLLSTLGECSLLAKKRNSQFVPLFLTTYSNSKLPHTKMVSNTHLTAYQPSPWSVTNTCESTIPLMLYSWYDVCIQFNEPSEELLYELRKILDYLIASNVKPAVISEILDIVNQLLAHAFKDVAIMQRILKPDMSLLLSDTSIRIKRSKGISFISTPLGQQQIGTLAILARYSSSASEASTLMTLFTPWLKRPSEVLPEKVIVALLNVIGSLMQQVLEGLNAYPTKHLD